MQGKNIVFGAVTALLAVGVVASTSWAVCLNNRLKRLENQTEAGTRASPQHGEQIGTPDAGTRASPLQKETGASPHQGEHVMKVRRVEYSGEDTLYVKLTERPDMDVVRSYVTVGPLQEGAPSFRYDTYYDYDLQSCQPQLVVSGDFAHRTNVTLRIRRGFPVYGLTASSNVVVEALARDYVFTFQRKDLKPCVTFTDKGRYLPPLGKRAVSLSSVNVGKIAADIRAVPPANLVLMLALEEGAYDKIRHGWAQGDDSFMTDLSALVSTNVLVASNVLNVEEKLAVPIVPPAGAATNGVFLVSVGNLDQGRDDITDATYWWEDNRWHHRVVCVSDLGLSVRQTEKGLYVWVTSLTQGTPVADAKVEVYSTANVLVAKGHADANGWCVCETVAKGEPFAVIVSKEDGSDRTFLAIRKSMNVAESLGENGTRPAYLAPAACTAFAWTERGIYRHGEKIFFHALIRNGEGVAPKPFPVTLELHKPSDDLYVRKTLMPDAYGAVADESFAVPAELPSGTWTFRLVTPGEKGAILGERKVRIEEFAPPQIRVKVAPAHAAAPRDFSFTVSAEHLYGGPAKELKCAGAVVFEDAPFTPVGWKGYSFGSEDRHLKPSFREIAASRLDTQGRHVFEAPLFADTGKPAALVKVTAQGTVFEDGGRPANARGTTYLHYYPYYIGSTLGSWLRMPEMGKPTVAVACVAPDGKRVAAPKKLSAKLERVVSIYAYRRGESGWATWDCTRVRELVRDGLALTTAVDGDTTLELPVAASGDYVLTITDPETDVAFSRTFYLSDWGDDEVRAPLANPTAVSIAADKPFYRPGDVPRLVVKSPFAGTALVSVYRDDFLYARVVTLTNATSEIALDPVTAENAPDIDVKISVLQSVAENARHLAVRAHGEKTLVVRRAEDELEVTVDAKVSHASSSDAMGTIASTASLVANVAVRGIGGAAVPSNAVAVVTVVDEGINILTDEKTPDPIAYFARPRGAENPLYDLYHRILPVLGDDLLKANGIKTGGGFGAEMLGRVSPTPTRRFKPLARWQRNVTLKDGKASVTFALPEFVGEVRVTAVAYDARATGAASVQQKICPNLVMQPDAPRFVAPGDTFEVTLSLANRSGKEGEIAWNLRLDEAVREGANSTDRSARALARTETAATGMTPLSIGASTVIRRRFTAPAEPGQVSLTYTATGFGETHTETIELPVRPAVPWRETAGVETLAPGETYEKPQTPQFRYTIVDTPLAELKGALEWLSDYPHGCLEQTTSRIFPLLAADGIFDALAEEDVRGEQARTPALQGWQRAATNREAYIQAGVQRVESMIRAHDFVMWPDCNYAPWDPEVSLYAAHFLVEADKTADARGSIASTRLTPLARIKVMAFLNRWALSPTNAISAYACHTLALAGDPNRDRMLRLYDDRAKLDLLSRARLARAFVKTGDRKRAAELLKNAASPASVREAAFLMLALLELDPSDARVNGLAVYLLSKRDKQRYAWGTTGENAHALLALGAYYRVAGVAGAGAPPLQEHSQLGAGTPSSPHPSRRFVCWHRLDLPGLASCTNETSEIALTRTYRTSTGETADLTHLSRGDLLIVELRLTSFVARDYNDLVIEDLFPGAFEPVLGGLDLRSLSWATETRKAADWVMRSDARDDRMLVFSKKFHLEANEEVVYRYQVRVVSAGAYALPGVGVEAMYQPDLRARVGAGRLVVHD